jgi:GTP cyclohydrolase II
VFAPLARQGYDLRPTIAITQAQLNLPEVEQALAKGELTADGVVLQANGAVAVTKMAIDPVWYLPGIAKRLRVSEKALRRALYEQTGGMFAELISRFDLKVWLPPIGGATVYVFGNVSDIADVMKPLTLRIHDECNGSDVFGSDICTCRPYLIHGIEECVKTAQSGGVGIVVYLRKEGRALGEVTKFLVYNARKRTGDSAEQYFERTECVAGVQDMRFQEFMPDILHWLGVRKIDRLISMSDMKYNAIVNSGITVIDRVAIPDELIPQDAWVEISAKKQAGYFSGS